MITRILAAIGAASLAILAFWAFLFVIAPNVPSSPMLDQSGAAASLRNPALRDVSAQPHTAVPADAKPEPTKAAPAPGPSPIRPLPAPTSVTQAAPVPSTPATSPPASAVSTVAAPAPSAQMPAVSAAAAPAPQAPGARQFLANEGDLTTGAVDAVPARRPRRAGNCTRYRTYDPQTQSYRGYDGMVHPCP